MVPSAEVPSAEVPGAGVRSAAIRSATHEMRLPTAIPVATIIVGLFRTDSGPICGPIPAAIVAWDPVTREFGGAPASLGGPYSGGKFGWADLYVKLPVHFPQLPDTVYCEPVLNWPISPYLSSDSSYGGTLSEALTSVPHLSFPPRTFRPVQSLTSLGGGPKNGEALVSRNRVRIL